MNDDFAKQIMFLVSICIKKRSKIALHPNCWTQSNNEGCSFFMTKFNAEDKLAAVQRYLIGGESYASIGASIGTYYSVVMNWVLQFQHHGEDAFIKSYTRYSTEFKLDVLKYMNDYGTSPNETAAIFKIASPGLIRKWRRQYESHGLDALKSKKKRRPTMEKETKKSKKQNLLRVRWLRHFKKR